MRCAIIIPARYGSSRLRGKPLLRGTGKYLIQHVYENALRCRRADEVIIATDDPRIVAAVRGFGGNVVLTRRDHPSGTDRVAEAARVLRADVIINVQGDEPDLDPSAIDLLPTLLERDPEARMATLAVTFRERRGVRESQLREGRSRPTGEGDLLQPVASAVRCATANPISHGPTRSFCIISECTPIAATPCSIWRLCLPTRWRKPRSSSNYGQSEQAGRCKSA